MVSKHSRSAGGVEALLAELVDLQCERRKTVATSLLAFSDNAAKSAGFVTTCAWMETVSPACHNEQIHSSAAGPLASNASNAARYHPYRTTWPLTNSKVPGKLGFVSASNVETWAWTGALNHNRFLSPLYLSPPASKQG